MILVLDSGLCVWLREFLEAAPEAAPGLGNFLEAVSEAVSGLWEFLEAAVSLGENKFFFA